jgi:GNAT superfamily N-acetyltransferase
MTGLGSFETMSTEPESPVDAGLADHSAIRLQGKNRENIHAKAFRIPVQCTELVYGDATAQDIELMKELIFEHGQNRWNYIPEEGVSAYLAKLDNKQTLAHLAFCQGELVGFITFHLEWEGLSGCDGQDGAHCDGYLAELVVHRDLVGRGIGTTLSKAAVACLVDMNARAIWAERHEEHAASARILQKVGFEIVDTYYDPERRFTGTRSTAVSRFVMAEREEYASCQ